MVTNSEIYKQASTLLDLIFGNTESVSSLLRRARLVAHAQRKIDLVNWIDKELNGYSLQDNIPDYRKSSVVQSYSWTGSLPRYYPENYKKQLYEPKFIPYTFHQSIPELEQYKTNDGTFIQAGKEIALSWQDFDINKKWNVRTMELEAILTKVKDELGRQMEDIVLDFGESENPISNISLNNLIDILKRFNDFRKYDKNNIENEDGVRCDTYKVLKPVFKDLIDEEYLRRFGLKNPKVDFAIPSIKKVIENKFIGEKKDLPRVQEEILADIPSYLQGLEEIYDGIIVFIYSKVNVPTDFIENLKKQKGIVEIIVAYAV